MDSRRIKSGDAEIAYWAIGDGPAVVLLHPFPASHEIWLPVAEALSTRYRMILPDLRGHGDSGVGEGPATMEKHAGDVARMMDDADIGRATLIGASIGGYALFEFWRRQRARMAALGLFNTKAPADSSEGRSARLQAAEDVLRRGTGPFLESMIPRLFGRTSREMRQDLVEGVADDAKNVSRGSGAGAAGYGGTSGFGHYIDDHRCSCTDRHRRGGCAYRGRRRAVDATEYFRKRIACDSEGGALFAVGATGGSYQDIAAVSGWCLGAPRQSGLRLR